MVKKKKKKKHEGKIHLKERKRWLKWIVSKCIFLLLVFTFYPMLFKDFKPPMDSEASGVYGNF